MSHPISVALLEDLLLNTHEMGSLGAMSEVAQPFREREKNQI